MKRSVGFCVLGLWCASPGALDGAERTFAHDVWPILEAHCVGCHQPGEIGPMPLTSYREARPWARAIREAVQTRAMPPWSARPGAHAFRNSRALTDADIAAVVQWADHGAPEGAERVEFVPRRGDSGWKLGKPDLIIRIPGFEVPATGQVPYSFLISSGLFPKDTWVRAAEWRIDHREAIHHVNAFARRPDSSFLAGFPAGQIFVPTLAERGKRRPNEALFARRQLLLGYEPGYEQTPWLEDGAKLIEAGSDIVFEMHYTPNGKAVTDRSEFGLYFAKGAPAYRVLAIDTLRDLNFEIPPQANGYVSKASVTLKREARLLSIQPHMHLRGKSMSVAAICPDGRVDRLLDVPRYDFNWQTTYRLEGPVLLGPGTRLESTAAFDNSSNNRFNPDPSATVRWGDQTTEEMHIAFLELAIPAGEDPDTLLEP